MSASNKGTVISAKRSISLKPKIAVTVIAHRESMVYATVGRLMP